MSDIHSTTAASTTANRSATSDHRGATGVATDAGRYTENRERRITTETKSSYKTTELIAYVAAVIGVLIASAVTDTSDFGTQEAWFLHHPADHRLPREPRFGQVRQQRAVRRRAQEPLT